MPEWGSLEGTMAETLGSENISPKLQRVAQRQRVRDGVYRLAASPCSEEPYAVVPHVRICGSPGRATASGHPAIVEPVTPAAYPTA